MKEFVPPDDSVIYETAHWRVNHRCDTPYPGYLMIGAKQPEAARLSDLAMEAQRQLGPLIAQATRFLHEDLGAKRVYEGRYGHSPGHAVHYHLIPVYDWTVAAYLQDGRFRVLQQFYGPGPEISTPEAFDGADMTLFIWRTFAEPGVLPPSIDGPTVNEVVGRLRRLFEAAEPIVFD